jgi:oligopeptide/dipeptide ABC transporter ATP-binding protein
MYLGRIVEFGNAQSVLATPLHPYTQALVSAIPVPGKSSLANRILLPGELPSPANPPGGCAFHTRCPYAKPACMAQRPELQDAPTPDDPLRQVACPFCNTSGQVK